MSKRTPETPLIIRVDQREKLPYTFECMREAAVLPFTVQFCHLKTGDYEASTGPLPSDSIVIERKSLCDLYSSYGSDREREIRKLERMSLFGCAVLVIEAELSQIMAPNKFLSHPTQLTPKSLVATLIAYQQRYGIHLAMCPGREVAEVVTFRQLERWVRDHDIRQNAEPRDEIAVSPAGANPGDN